MRLATRRCCSAALLLALTSACGSDGDSLRREVLIHLTDAVIVPANDQLHADAGTLVAAIDTLCSSAAVAPAQSAWRTVRADWSILGAFSLGPVVTQMQAGELDFWPVREATIEDKISAAPATIDATYLASLGVSARGLPALEYLLFTTPPAGPRCAYARALAEDIERRTGEIADAWHSSAADALREAGHGSTVYASEQAGLDAVVNAAIEGLYRIVKDKLDRPLGNLSGSDPDPDVVESRYSGTALVDITGNLDGFARMYFGADLESGGEPGLDALVAAKDSDLDARIVTQLGVARAALAAVPAPLADTLIADRSVVQTARDEVDALRRLIKLDVASLLGVTLMLSDNDGD